MASLASAGIGSGIDIGALVTSLVDAERTPATSRYDSQEETLQAQVSGYGTLKSSLSSFKSSLSTLKFSSSFNAMSATTSDDTLVTGTASSIAKEGSFALTVTTLAQQHSISTSSSFTDVTDTIGTGTLSFDFGYSDGGSPAAFVSNSDKTTKTVTISSDNNSLSGVRDAVNTAGIGVTASIVDITGSGSYKLIFTSDDTGKENGLKISVTNDDDSDDADISGLSQLAFDPTNVNVAGTPSVTTSSNGGMTENMTATDAAFTINGLSMTNASNSIGSAVSGMTFNLKATTASAINITVAADTSTVLESVTEFTTKFNELTDTLNLLGDYDFTTQEGGALLGDSVLRGIESKIRRLLTSSVTDASGNSASLSSVGIRTGDDGKLAVDTATLNTAIAADSTLLSRLFSAQSTTSDSQVSYVSSTSSTKTGDYSLELSTVASRGSLTGASHTSAIDLTTAASLEISIDGVASGVISLTQQSYTGTALANKLQSQINADATLSGASKSVSVSYDSSTNTLSLYSDLISTSSTIEITALTNMDNSGLVIGTGTTGTATTSGVLTGGVSTSMIDLTGFSPALTLSVDGVSSGSISLTGQSYATGADFAAEIQAKINASTTLTENGSSIVVSYSAADNTLSLLSALYGSSSTIEITSLTDLTLAATGLSVATGTTGTDVAGTFDGNAATGSGTFLTGTSGDSNGLKIDVSGGSTGNRGLVSFNRGIADELDTMLTDFLAADSLIDNRTSGLTANIARITEQRAELDVKMSEYETRLFKQFNTMDSIVAQLKATGDYLTSQLENLPGVVKKDN